MLIVFDDIIANMLKNNKFNQMITELFSRSRKFILLNIYITQSYFAVPKTYQNKFYTLLYYENSKQTRPSTKQHLIIHKILTLCHYESLQKMYCKIIFLLLINAALVSSNPTCFRKKLKKPQLIMTTDDGKI